MNTFVSIKTVTLWILCIIVFSLIMLSELHLKVLIVPVEYQYQDVDEMIHLIENYRMYYLYSGDYVKELERCDSTINRNNLKRDYNRYKDSVVWDNEDYSTSVEYIYPKK